MDAGTLLVIAILVDAMVGVIVAGLASRRDWSAWQHRRRPDWRPMAASPAGWFAVVAIAGPFGVLAYALDHSHAPA